MATEIAFLSVYSHGDPLDRHRGHHPPPNPYHSGETLANTYIFRPLQEGKYPDDRTSVVGQTHVDLLETLLSQPGCQRCYWGREVENKDMLRWFVDWDSIDSHKKFIASE